MPATVSLVRIQDQLDFSGSLTSGYFLKWNGSAFVLDAVSPGGSDTQVQFNDGGGFGGDAGLTWDKTNNALVLTSSHSAALAVGPGGNTNPVLRVVANVASAATGLSVTGNAAGSGVTLTALSSGTNESLVLLPKGTGAVVVRQPSGTPGTHELQISHNGSRTLLDEKGGELWVLTTGSNGFGVVSTDASSMPGILLRASDSTVYLRTTGRIAWASIAGNIYSAADIACNRNAANVLEVNNGTAGQWGSLLCGTRDTSTTAVTNGLTIGHQASSGTPAAGMGSALRLRINSSTTADQDAGRLTSYWTDATHATRTAAVGIDVVSNAGSLAEVLRVTGSGTIGTGLSVTGNAAGSGVILTALSSGSTEELYLDAKGSTTANTGVTFRTTGGSTFARLNWYEMSGNVQGRLRLGSGDVGIWQTGGSELVFGSAATYATLLMRYGLVTWSGLNFGWVNKTLNGSAIDTGTVDTALTRNAAAVVEVNNGTAGQWGSLLCGTRDTSTTAVTNGLTIGHQASSGTPAAGMGSAICLRINSSTTADQAAGRVQALWADATHATRSADLVLTAYYTSTEREGVRVRGGSGGAQLGFYGVNPVSRQVLATGAGATVDDVITAMQNLGLVKQS